MQRFNTQAIVAKRRAKEGPKTVKDKVFLDITIGGRDAGRIVIKLRADKAPKSAENFRMLCTGEQGESPKTGTVYWYKGVPFHRVAKGFIVQGGDIVRRDGTSGECALRYNPEGKAAAGHYDDEPFLLSHDRPGRVSMANKGPHTNNSQFFITLSPCTHLDKKNICFGEVIKGMEVVQAIGRLETKGVSSTGEPTPDAEAPLLPVVISDCGELPIEEDEEHETEEQHMQRIIKEQELQTEQVVSKAQDAVTTALASKNKRPTADSAAPKRRRKGGMFDVNLDSDSEDS